MTDNEIVKALGCCLSSDDLIACWKCPAVKLDICCDGSSKISNGITNKVIDLINRQKAELEKKDIEIDILIKKKEALRDEIQDLTAAVERLTEENIILSQKRTNLIEIVNSYERGRAEAIKEFWSKLKTHSRKMQSSDFSGEFWDRAILVEDGDNLVKEMVGD
jgi:hypothetical protein